MNASSRPSLCVIGAGPRGTSILERLRANAPIWAKTTEWELHLVEESEFGAGRVWRTDQTHELCMNTFAGAVTNFTDESVDLVGPVVEGPTMFEWCMLALHDAEQTERTRDFVESVDSTRVTRFRDVPVRAALITGFLDELRSIKPESHPSRALYGEYLVWCHDRALHDLPEGATVHLHRTRAERIERTTDSRERVLLSDGSSIECDAVVFAGGWLDRRPSAADLALNDRLNDALTWVRPGSPVDQDLGRVPSAEPVIIRGLGMGFFDTVTLLTVGRGGSFEETTDGLKYRRSGHEPIVYATSRRGIPFRAKSVYDGLPPVAEHRHLRRVEWSAVLRPLDFAQDIWPLIVRDAYESYYRVLVGQQPDAVPLGIDPILDAVSSWRGSVEHLGAIIEPFVPDPADRFDLDAVAHAPVGQFASAGAFDDWVADYLRSDLESAEVGTRSPLKAALWSVGAARKFVAELISFGGLHADSYFAEYRDFTALGGMVGSGPPAFRTRQLLALQRAGLVHFIGPAATVNVDEDTMLFRAESTRVAGSMIESSTLIDAWMHMHDATLSEDPLILDLLAQQRIRSHTLAATDGTPKRTASIDIDPHTSRAVNANGAFDPSIHVIGIPVDDSRGDTIISPMPGANSTMLRETDRVAHSVYEILTAAHPELHGERSTMSVDGSRPKEVSSR